PCSTVVEFPLRSASVRAGRRKDTGVETSDMTYRRRLPPLRELGIGVTKIRPALSRTGLTKPRDPWRKIVCDGSHYAGRRSNGHHENCNSGVVFLISRSRRNREKAI